jgi:hypothetical protein
MNYCEKLHDTTMENPEVMDKFLDTSDFHKLNKEDIKA